MCCCARWRAATTCAFPTLVLFSNRRHCQLSSLLGMHLGLHCALCAVVGVAKAVNLADTVAQTGFKGTPASMSPEQLKVAPPRRFRTNAWLHWLVEAVALLKWEWP